jgi:hypothetical protein
MVGCVGIRNPIVVDAHNFFREIKKHPDRFYIIHYSSQSLYDEGLDGLSPRITSIVVMHFSSRQTASFAIHAEAELLGIPKEQVEARLDDIERALLQRFYDFVSDKDSKDKYWIHWNMRNLTYGFEHLAHRYHRLSGNEPPNIPVPMRLNLNDILKERYGPDYAGHPRLKSLMLMNGDLDTRFLEGAEEADAFKKMEFIRMNSSTISKVEFFRYVITQAQRGKLHTGGMRLVNHLDRLLESRWARVLALIGSVIGITAVIIRVATPIH